MIIEKINSPEDVKKCTLEELKTLADEMRPTIVKKVNTVGGHFGPNLGIVETTIAMHYVFNSPTDKFVFDVSHQCYQAPFRFRQQHSSLVHLQYEHRCRFFLLLSDRYRT